jgi:DNA primase
VSLPPEFLDAVRARTGLAALVGRKVKLVRAGHEWKGCCPFHSEKTPSFYVNEDKGFYHCFGCGAHGDAIRYLTEAEGLGFLDAVRLLADQAGLPMPEPAASPARAHRVLLHRLVEVAARFYAENLRSPAGHEARAYLAGRGIDAAVANHFGLGLAPAARTGLLAAVRRHEAAASPDLLREAGLQGQSDSGEAFDRFRGRLMFPIHDVRGKAVGFGGRTLTGAEPKYLNSPEGPLFAKGHLLYNLHRAAPAARRSARLLVVEGYMDVVALHRVGIGETVAPLGTALTAEQMALCWRLVAEPVLAFDGDGAGRRAAHRAAVAALPLLQPGRSFRFLLLPAGKDPDDLVRDGGRPAVDALLEATLPLDRFLFEAEAGAGPLDTPERRAGFRARLHDLAQTIADQALRADYRRNWLARADRLGLPPPAAAAHHRPRTPRGRAPQPALPEPLRPETRSSGTAEERVLEMLLASFAIREGAAARHGEALAGLPVGVARLSAWRDDLLDGRTGQRLAWMARPLWPASLPDDEFDRRAADALASLAELHHIQAALHQPSSDNSAGAGFMQDQARRAALVQAWTRATARLAALAMPEGEI